MFEVVLYQPEIPPNTGNVIRLCANTGCHLHLVEPLGFRLDDRELRARRARLPRVRRPFRVHEGWQACRAGPRRAACARLSAPAARSATIDSLSSAGDAFVFGAETRGLPAELLAGFARERRLRLPMRPGQRSLNLSNAVAVVVYEAWRQIGFAGAG